MLLKKLHKDLGISFRPVIWALIGIALFFGFTLPVFMSLEGWALDEALYFGVVTITTVGYGDFTPTTNSTRLITGFYVLLGAVLIWTTISYSIASISRQLRMSAKKHTGSQVERGIFDRSVYWRRFLEGLAYFGLFVLMGTVFSTFTIAKTRRQALELQGAAEHTIGNDWATGLYFTLITLTTVGYGEITPKSLPERAFMMIMMLLGIPLFASLLTRFTELIFSGETIQLRTLVTKLTREKFDRIEALGAHLKNEGGRANQISEYQFMAYLLVANRVLNPEDVQVIMAPFYEHDKTKKGYLDATDIEDDPETRRLVRGIP